MKASSLDSLLNQHEENSRRYHENSIEVALFQERLSSYLLKRIQWPLISSLFLVCTRFLFWSHLQAIFPIFDWGDLFSTLQATFLFSTLISAGVETLRSQNRRSKKSHSAGTWLFLISFLPLFAVLIELARDLSLPGRYFGVYDLLIAVFWIRIPLSLFNRIRLSRQSHRRVAMKVYHWAAPPVLGLLILFLLDSVLKTWTLPFAVAAESILFFILQQNRIRARPHSSAFKKLRLSDLRFLMHGTLVRLPSLLPQIGFHLSYIYLYRYGELTPQTQVLLHSFQPLLSFLFQIPHLFWKEILDFYESQFLVRFLRKAMIAASLFWFVLLIPFSTLLAAMAPLIWIQFEGMPYWLGRDHLGKRLRAPKHEKTFAVTFRRGFWRKFRREAALKELDFGSYSIADRYLLVRAPKDALHALAFWGRGWIHSIQDASQLQHTGDPNAALFDFQTLKWTRPLPVEWIQSLSIADQTALAQSLFRGIQSGGRGRFQIAGYRIRWSQNALTLSVRLSRDRVSYPS